MGGVNLGSGISLDKGPSGGGISLDKGPSGSGISLDKRSSGGISLDKGSSGGISLNKRTSDENINLYKKEDEPTSGVSLDKHATSFSPAKPRRSTVSERKQTRATST